MKVNLNEFSSQITESTTNNTVKMRLSENATTMIFRMFTENIYSNPIGSIVREITSNCFDSHVEANVNSPVIIKKTYIEEDKTHHISFIDFGVGMSPNRVKNIYGVYFESTKRLDDNQIGGFGIGCKTVLAYKRSTGQGEGEYDNSFHVITIYNGIKYYYCIYEGVDTPVISLLYQESTTEHNGTEIRIPVLEKDVYTFECEMLRQLYYFENIVFEGFDCKEDGNGSISNDYQIIRGKNFLYRGKDYNDRMHVCLGRVAYPLDFSVLGLVSSEYQIPVAIKLNVGDIGVTVSRESLDYSESTIKTLKKKIIDTKEEIKQLLIKQYDDVVTLEDYFKVKNNFGQLFIGKKTLFVGNLLTQKDVDFSNFKFNSIKIPNDKQLFNFFFNIKSYGKKQYQRRYNRYSSTNIFEGGYDQLCKKNNLYYVEDFFNRKIIKQAYLKSQHETYYIISKSEIANNYKRNEIAEIFNVCLDSIIDDKGNVNKYVQTLLDMQEEYFNIVRKHCINYDNINIPEDFITNRKRTQIPSELRQQSISVKFIGGYKSSVKLNNLFNYNMPIFYGTSDYEYKLLEAYRIFTNLFGNIAVYSTDYKEDFNCSGGKKSIMFIMVAKNNIKHMQYCKKAYHINEFYHRMLYRKENIVLNYFQCVDMFDKYDKLDDLYVNDMFIEINTKYGKKINEINKYIKPLQSSTEDIKSAKSYLMNYFNVNNIQKTGEQKRILKMIESVIKLQENNQKTLRYINMPYISDKIDDDFVNLMKKILIF